MPTPYFRWIKTGSVDMEAALGAKPQIRSHYIAAGKLHESRSAVWLFRLDLDYRPGVGILSDRQLVRIEFSAEGEAIMESVENHINFENSAFAGEAGHPLLIIIKSNERGARGVGAKILEYLNARLTRISLASAAEVKKATS